MLNGLIFCVDWEGGMNTAIRTALTVCVRKIDAHSSSKAKVKILIIRSLSQYIAFRRNLTNINGNDSASTSYFG
jgi:hypothetical protein